jgi:hypothetical protein
MKKKNTLNIVISLGLALFIIVAIAVLFADAFGESSRGNCFEVMFGSTDRNYNAVPELIIAFCLEGLALILSFVSLGIKGKGRGGMYIFISALLVVAAVFFLMSPTFYVNHNSIVKPVLNIAISGGTISTVTFCFIGAALGLLGAYAGLKKPAENDD